MKKRNREKRFEKKNAAVHTVCAAAASAVVAPVEATETTPAPGLAANAPWLGPWGLRHPLDTSNTIPPSPAGGAPGLETGL